MFGNRWETCTKCTFGVTRRIPGAPNVVKCRVIKLCLLLNSATRAICKPDRHHGRVPSDQTLACILFKCCSFASVPHVFNWAPPTNLGRVCVEPGLEQLVLRLIGERSLNPSLL